MALAVPAPQATADTRPSGTTPVTASVDALPTVQVNGVVWETEIVGRTAYAVGKFTAARPAGAAQGGPEEVPRSNILAFDVETGELLPFAPVLNAQALEVEASPDGSRIYVGGDFTSVDGVVRSKIAAFSTSTGALLGFRPGVSSRVRALAVTGTTVYAGGDFKSVNGIARTRLAAFLPTGTLLPWAPTADDDVVEALVAAPDDSRVIVGGRFQTLNLQDFVGVGAVEGATDSRTGLSLPWSAKVTPPKKEINGVMKRSWVTDLVVQDGVVYGSNNGDGFHWFDGRWAARFDTGELVWLDNCYGATYGVFVRSQVLYSVGHPHDCASIGAFPETSPITYRRALAETTYAVGTDSTPPSTNSSISNQPVPGLLHWFPDLNAGSFTGQGQGPWTITGNDRYLVMGGEFTRVNGKSQQGLTRFAVSDGALNGSPDDVGPEYAPTLLPSALSLAAGSVRVAWPVTWDRDNARLTYSVYRDDKTLVFSADQEPTGWTPSGISRPTAPSMGFTDVGLTPGAVHRYKLVVQDPFGNTLDYMRTPEVTVAGSGPAGYPAAVLADGATSYWRLGKGSPRSFDHAGYNDLVIGAGVATAPGALADDADAAGSFDGSEAGVAVTEAPVAASGSFSLEAWVRTTSTSGGKILGYASNTAGTASHVHDRSLYIDGTGTLVFGVRTTSGLKTVASPSGFADGEYHHVVGTFSPETGMMLYVDGKRVSSLTGLTAIKAPLGYWRIGGDNLDGWPKKPASRHLAGSIDEVAVYPTALPATAISAHSAFRPAPPNAAPTAQVSGSCVDLDCVLDASGSGDADGSISSYSFDFGDGSAPVTGSSAKVSHTYAAAGTYPVTVTVTDDAGATGSASTSVSPTAAGAVTVLAEDGFERSVTGGWGSAPTGGAWSVSGGSTNFSVGGGTGNVLVAAGKAPAATLGSPSSASADVSVTLTTDKPPTGGGMYVYVVGRRVGSDSYRAKVRLRSDGSVGVALVRVVSGTETALTKETTVSGLSFSAGSLVRVRMSAVGTGTTALKAKVWAAAASEPSSWLLSASDTTAALQTAGGLGLGTYLSGTATNAPITVRFDGYRATSP